MMSRENYKSDLAPRGMSLAWRRLADEDCSRRRCSREGPRLAIAWSRALARQAASSAPMGPLAGPALSEPKTFDVRAILAKGE